MLRVLLFMSLAGLVGLAAPVAAVDADTHCASVTLAFTESDETHVDIYVTELVHVEGGAESVDLAWVKDVVATVAQEAANAMEPGEASRGGMIIQFEVQVAQNDEPPVTGLRLSYLVDLSACTGI